MQDRDGACDLLRTTPLLPVYRAYLRRRRLPGAEDRGRLAKTGSWADDRPAQRLHRFVVLPKRWIVERTFAWISRNRRLARDFERYARTVAAFIRLAMIRIMLRRLTKPTLSPESFLLGSALTLQL